MYYSINTVTFSSRDYELIAKLHKLFIECYSNSSNGQNLVKHLFEAADYYPAGLNPTVNSNDAITDCQNTIIKRESVFCFYCEISTSCIESMEAFITMLEDRFMNKVYISFISEVIGGDYRLVVKDDTGIFYPDIFKLEYRHKSTCNVEYFSCFFDLVDYLRKVFPKANISYYDHIEDIRQAIDDAYKQDDSEYFMNVLKFEEYSSSKSKIKEVA